MLLLLGPLATYAFGGLDLSSHWRDASMRSAGMAPDPAEVKEPVVQVYAARAFNWRGAFAVHTWIASKRANASSYSVYQVIGWQQRRTGNGVSVQRGGPPDFLWYNARPEILISHRGDHVEAMIDHIEAAVASYPDAARYSVWPGPNSNTFVAYVARQVPELGVDLPPTAIGKDYLGAGEWLAPVPSGTGWQVSLAGLLGVALAREEGLEVNLLGLSIGIDANDLALRLPGIGKVGLL